MASLNPESDISAFVNTIFEQSLLIAREQNLMTKLVRNFTGRTGLAPRQNQQYNGVTMGTVAETDDLVSQQFVPTAIATVTPIEVGAQYFLTDSRVESDPFTVQSDASQDLGLGLSQGIDKDLLGKFSSFTGGTVGTAGSAITWGHVFAAEAQLRTQLAPYPYIFVCNPSQWAVLAKAASVASGAATNAADSLKEAVNSMYFIKNVGPISIFTSGNLATGTTVHAGMFSRDALAFDQRRAPRMESDRDPSRRGYELNISAVYGFGVWRPKFGIDMVFDGSLPTA